MSVVARAARLPCRSGRSVGSPLCERSITSPTSATLSCNCWPSERGLLPETSGLRCLRLGSVSVLAALLYCLCIFGSGERAGLVHRSRPKVILDCKGSLLKATFVCTGIQF